MKALSLLEDYLNAVLDGDDFNKAAEIQQAITELQATQTSMTCEGCVHIDHKTEAIDYQLHYPCRSCVRAAADQYYSEDNK